MYEPPEGPLVWTAADLGPGSGPGRRPFVRPLPDPVAIRVRAIPDAAPPYDEEPAEGGADRPGADQPGADRPGADQPGADRPGADRLAAAIVAVLGTQEPSGTEDALGRPKAAGARKGGSGDGPLARTAPVGEAMPGEGRGRAGTTAGEPVWPSRFAQVLAETLAGSRPPAQLVPWTTERARSNIRRLGPMLVGRQQPVVRRVLTSRPADGVLEVSVVVGVGPRVRALALRLEREPSQHAAPGRPGRTGRWICTAVEAA
jgi:Family of unknown function (DUF6459)